MWLRGRRRGSPASAGGSPPWLGERSAGGVVRLRRRCRPPAGVFLGLWLDASDGQSQLLPGCFDGAYTYFGSEDVSYAANPQNWAEMSRCVGAWGLGGRCALAA
jgi:hypothetical protein